MKTGTTVTIQVDDMQYSISSAYTDHTATQMLDEFIIPLLTSIYTDTTIKDSICDLAAESYGMCGKCNEEKEVNE